ncbi:GTP-sensing pleiotropic transcriptional regulator CodY, partial [Clostridium perfringens]|nr:GTP-sensing pleiotropic transcriptional regulator CodY [Clostridium perfringens]
MSSLLNKTRMLNKILQKSGTDPVAFEDICSLLSEVLSCNVYVTSTKGKILGYTFSKIFECDIMKNQVIDEKRFPKEYNDNLLNIHESIANLNNKGLCVFEGQGSCIMKDKITTIVPIIGNRERLGTLMLARFGEEFTDEDLVLAEYSAAIVGMEILRSKQVEIE